MYTSLVFLSVANSARSQMAEGLARTMFGRQMRVQSAGSQPSQVHPQAIAAMREVGIDITGQHSKSVDSIDLDSIEVVITLCAEEVCLARPHGQHDKRWPLPDPAIVAPDASPEAVAAQFRAMRRAARTAVGTGARQSVRRPHGRAAGRGSVLAAWIWGSETG